MAGGPADGLTPSPLPPAKAVSRSVEAVWRIEGARIVATLARITGDFSLAEDVAAEAVVEALQQWSTGGVPRNPGAWLTAVAKRRAIDVWRRRQRLDDRYRALAHDLEEAADEAWQPVADDVLRLIFTACHPTLSRESQVALTLRVVGGLTAQEVARMLFVPVTTVQARITRAKQALAGVPFEAPDPAEWADRLAAVTAVVLGIFTEGYAATAGDRWIRADLAAEGLRLGRLLSALLPRDPELLGLVALMELQAARFASRVAADGSSVDLEHQNRARWDRAQIARGRAALERAAALAPAPGPFVLRARIAECHAVAPTFADTDWRTIVTCYDRLLAIEPSHAVELNRAVAVASADGPEAGLAIVDRLAAAGALPASHLLPSVRGGLLARLGRVAEAREELLRAAERTPNARQRQYLESRAAALPAAPERRD